MKILPVETQEEAVAQGARLLDEVRPGWHHTVNGAIVNETFRMTHWDHCVAGTLELVRKRAGEFGREMYIQFNGIAFPLYSQESEWVGFDALTDYHNVHGRSSYDELEELWQAEVAKRMAADAETV